MLRVKSIPPGGSFIEFLRVDIIADDDGQSPVIAGPFNIKFTTDGSIPGVSSTTQTRRSPIRQFPIDKATTLKFLTTNIPETATSDINTEFYDVTDLTAKNDIRYIDPRIRNFTLRVEDGDIQRTDGGLYDLVYGVNKTTQDIKEVILVEAVPSGQISGDRTLPQFGSALNTILGRSFPAGFAATLIQTSIFKALNALKALQEDEEVPTDEKIDSILNITVVPIDPTSFKYRFVVKTVSGITATSTGRIVGR